MIEELRAIIDMEAFDGEGEFLLDVIDLFHHGISADVPGGSVFSPLGIKVGKGNTPDKVAQHGFTAMSDGISFQVSGLSWFPVIRSDCNFIPNVCSWAGIGTTFVGMFDSDLFKDPINGGGAYGVQFVADMGF